MSKYVVYNRLKALRSSTADSFIRPFVRSSCIRPFIRFVFNHFYFSTSVARSIDSVCVILSSIIFSHFQKYFQAEHLNIVIKIINLGETESDDNQTSSFSSSSSMGEQIITNNEIYSIAIARALD